MNALDKNGREAKTTLYIAPILVFAILTLPATLAQATPINFYTNGSIVDGNSFGIVKIWDNATVNMTGGWVGEMATYNTSMLNIYDGEFYTLGTYDESVVNMFGGTASFVIGGLDSSVINLRGGTIRSVGANSSSATINVFGFDLAKTDTGGTWGVGQVTGFWQDGIPFSIDLRSDTYASVNLIPEPATLLLLGVGGVFLFRKTLRKTR
jgi:hypothetical protein